MTAKDAISPQIAPLRLSTPYADAVESLSSVPGRALPVVDQDGVYLGMFGADGCARCADAVSVADCVEEAVAVRESYPMSMLLESMASARKSVIPVVDDFSGRYVGAVDAVSMLACVSRLFPQLQESTELTVTCAPGNYSASAIAHAVEDADAHLLNLNVVEGTEPQSRTTVTLRVNHSRGDSVARSLSRYGYETVEIAGSPGMPDSGISERINELLHYLEV